MAYTKHTWAENEIIDHAKLNNIENGVAANDAAVSELMEMAENVKMFFDYMHPKGCIYFSTEAQSPSQQGISDGTWVAIEGKFLFAQDSSHTAGSTGGEETHTLTIEEIPSHRHATHAFASTGTAYGFYTNGWNNASGYAENTDMVTFTGGGQPHNNMPPYLAVYCWKRTA